MSASRYFVTGTDTDVGKTVAAAYLVRALDADYWKPVQSGLEGETDTEAMQRLTGFSADRFQAPAYELRRPLSPHESARHDGVRIEMERFVLPPRRRALIVEGAGGVLVPLNDTALMVDLMRRLDLPVVVVARSTLGTINHTLLTLEALRARALTLAGVIMNGPPNAANRRAIEAYGRIAVIAEIPRFETLDAAVVAAFARAHPPRLKGAER